MTAQTQAGSLEPIILDNGLFVGGPAFKFEYSIAGGAAAYGGSYFETTSNQTVSAKAFFTNMLPGATYDIYMTWVPNAGLSTAVPVQISGATGIVTVDQTKEPSGISADGDTWKKIGSGKPVNDGTSNVLTVDVGANRTHKGKIQLDGLMAICVVNCATPPILRTVAAPLIIDSTTMMWDTDNFTTVSNDASYKGSHLQSNPETWESIEAAFMNLTPGATYDVYVTYAKGTPGVAAGNVPGYIYGDGAGIQTGFSAYLPIDGQWPNGITIANRPWQLLGSAQPYDNKIAVGIGGPEADGTYQVDAVMAICRNNCAAPATDGRVIIDDGPSTDEGNGYFVGGSTLQKIDASAYDGDFRECANGSVVYHFENMDVTSAYDLYATWVPASDLSRTVTYDVALYDKTLANPSTASVDQTKAAQGMVYAGRSWQKLSTVLPDDPRAGIDSFSVIGICGTGKARFDAVMAVKTTSPVAPAAACGNGIVEAGEQCDDKNAIDTDGCRNNCQIPRCGDGVKSLSEECDDGNAVNTDACRNNCQSPKCGDAIKDANEQCDDGNAVNTDACSNTCAAPKCGDGIVQSGEECDDGNAYSYDACTTICKKARCGDGVLQAGEQCDAGTLVVGWCRPDCTKPTSKCGNGIVETGEYCDDGNAVSTDACQNNCQAPRCGDAVTGVGEQCDDGNAVNTDACRTNCQLPKCGDAIKDANEQCDDGNSVDTDACTNACMKPVITAPTPPVAQPSTAEYVAIDDDTNTADSSYADAGFSYSGNYTVGNGKDTAYFLGSSATQSLLDSARAQWTFAGLRPGTYDVCAGWGIDPRMGVGTTPPLTKNARYGVGTSASNQRSTVIVDQTVAPTTVIDGRPCAPIGTATVTGSEHVIVTVQPGKDGYTLADVVIVRLRTQPTTGTPSPSPTPAPVAPTSPAAFCPTATCASGFTCNEAARACLPNPPVCGNGKTETGEECDDGNLIPNDACTHLCKMPVCGDGIVHSGEQCDPNAPRTSVDGLGCSACRITLCGDGFVTDMETCDDKNRVNGDGCSNACLTEY